MEEDDEEDDDDEDGLKLTVRACLNSCDISLSSLIFFGKDNASQIDDVNGTHNNNGRGRHGDSYSNSESDQGLDCRDDCVITTLGCVRSLLDMRDPRHCYGYCHRPPRPRVNDDFVNNHKARLFPKEAVVLL